VLLLMLLLVVLHALHFQLQSSAAQFLIENTTPLQAQNRRSDATDSISSDEITKDAKDFLGTPILRMISVEQLVKSFVERTF